MTSEAQRRAHAKLRKTREEAGKRTVSLWLSEPARKALDGLAKVHGSREAAVELWLSGRAPAPVARKEEAKPIGFAPDGSPIYAENRVRQREGKKR